MKKVLLKGAIELDTVCAEVQQNEVIVANELREAFVVDDRCIGYGLAANQIGILKRAVILSPTARVQDVFVMINLEIVNHGKEIDYVREGCLSQPGVEKEVGRYRVVDVEYRDENWVLHKGTFKGLHARIIQHELDHLNGLDCLVNRL